MVISTADLIRRYQAGQSDLFESLFDRYKDYVYRVAYSLTRHGAEAEEVVQEAFLDVLKALPRYDVNGPARFETWLYQVTANRCKMRLRRRRPDPADWDEVGEQLTGLPDDRPEDDPEKLAQQSETRRSLWRAVGRLKDIYREVVVLRYGHDLSYDEIAAALQINMGTVKSRLNAAHRQLQDLLSGGNHPHGPNAGRGQDAGMLAFLWLWVSGILPGLAGFCRAGWSVNLPSLRKIGLAT